MKRNADRQIVIEEWLRSASLRPEVDLDAFALMPNHFHGIVTVMAERRKGGQPPAPTTGAQNPIGYVSRTIGALVRGFKAATTKRINELRGTPRDPIWQRNYYEHIIRDGRELGDIRRYIWENPIRWANDEENPQNIGPPG